MMLTTQITKFLSAPDGSHVDPMNLAIRVCKLGRPLTYTEKDCNHNLSLNIILLEFELTFQKIEIRYTAIGITETWFNDHNCDVSNI